jgi:TonB dependent receptor/CarboxypepD_reg-like domain/TonB-dependent Receptor Plug Domain
MKSRILIWICCAVFLSCFTSTGLGQQDSARQLLITGEFKDMAATLFVAELEQQAGVAFYYDSTLTDSIRITLSVDRQPLDKVLEAAFASHGIYFALDAWNRVYLGTRPLIAALSSAEVPGNIKPPSNVSAGVEQDQEINFSAINKTTLENKLYQIGDKTSANNAQARVSVTGYVVDAKTGEPVSGAAVSVDKLKTGVVSDQYGYYLLSLPRGRYTVNIQSIGMKDTRRQIMVLGDGKLNIELQGQIMTLKKVVIAAQKLSNVKATQMGVQKIDIKTIKQVPVAFGEADLLRVMLTLPGVKSVGESSTGLYVRGGSADQNLILFNDMTIYNPSHFFGLFSAFNPEVVKDVQLYKSSVPARYGGRLSSVLDIESREGNKKDITGSAGIGLLTSRLELEGPLVKDKTSFILGVRTTYADWLLNALPEQYKNSKASFYDFNVGVSHEFDKKNSLYITGYLSRDGFNLNSDTLYHYGNQNFSLKWKHVFSNKLSGLFRVGHDRYQYDISSSENPDEAYKLSFDVNQTNVKAHFNYYLSSQHSIEFGFGSIYYKLHPGSYEPTDTKSLVAPDAIQPEKALESALYLSDQYSITHALSIEGGLRYSLYNYLGPQTINEYVPGMPRTTNSITGTESFRDGKIIQTYSGPEYRVSARYAFSDSFSIKAGYNTQRQYIHMLSNTTAMAPTDIWKLSDPYIRPQYGDQFSIGLYKNLKANTIEASLEVYYRDIWNYLDYKSGAILVMNPHIETDVFNTKGKAYGVELLIKKQTGKLNGWFSYTYSRVFSKQDDPLAGQLINNGNYYPTSYDIPHDATIVGNYRFTHRYSFSVNATYSTGRPITVPIANYYYSGSERTLYGPRNGYRLPDYFRMDMSFNIDGNHKLTQKTHNSWTFGVYNLTGRKNPYSVYFLSQNGVVNGYKLSIFGTAIPYVNYNIRF